MSAAQSELSMDEILASIRRIIHEEEQPAGESSPQAAPEMPPEVLRQPAASADEPPQETNDIKRGKGNTLAIPQKRARRKPAASHQPEREPTPPKLEEHHKVLKPQVRAVEPKSVKPMPLPDFGNDEAPKVKPAARAPQEQVHAVVEQAPLTASASDPRAEAAYASAEISRAPVDEADAFEPRAATASAPSPADALIGKSPADLLAEAPAIVREAMDAAAAGGRRAVVAQQQSSSAAAAPSAVSPYEAEAEAGRATPDTDGPSLAHVSAEGPPQPTASTYQAAPEPQFSAAPQTAAPSDQVSPMPSQPANTPSQSAQHTDQSAHERVETAASDANHSASAALQEELMSETAIESAAAAFASLRADAKASRPGSMTVDDLARDLLRPMLKAWLDENLPRIVEEKVAAEIKRLRA